MTVIGSTTIGATATIIADATSYIFDVSDPVPEDFTAGSVLAYMDGLGGGAGIQTLRAVVQEQGTGALPAYQGDPVTIAEGQSAEWVHLPFLLPPTLRAGFTLRAGILGGPISGVARLLGVPAGPAIAVCGLFPWPLPDVTDEEFARLPLDVAQRALGTAPSGAALSAMAGWHGLSVDPEVGSFAVVRTGGPLQDLVGSRLQVSANGRSVVVYVNHEQDFGDADDEDISLSKRAFLQIAQLYTEAQPVQVQVLG